ncbi:ArsR/SmtB family transcription factor [Streptomyces sp. NPDC087212]|uniref:ArsR/SmtB family transcription factor n=1 Tax=Streptomyces sp. NPDC087212 TaxID=3365766 RepID=UPI003820DF6A
MADHVPGEAPRVSDAARHKAMGHPTRQLLLSWLGRGPATISQLAGSLGVAKGSVGYHLKVLHGAGLVHVCETRRVRGGTERYYRRTPLTAAPPTQPRPAECPPPDNEPLTILRHLHLTPTQATHLRTTLAELAENTPPQTEAPNAAHYALLLTLHRR